MGNTYDWNYECTGGWGLDLEFSQGTNKSEFLENPYFMDLISSKIKHELTRLLTTAGAARIQDKHPSIWQCGLYIILQTALKDSKHFFSLVKTAS